MNDFGTNCDKEEFYYPMWQECLVKIDKVKDLALKADSNPQMILKKAQKSLSLDAAAHMTRHVSISLT